MKMKWNLDIHIFMEVGNFGFLTFPILIFLSHYFHLQSNQLLFIYFLLISVIVF